MADEARRLTLVPMVLALVGLLTAPVAEAAKEPGVASPAEGKKASATGGVGIGVVPPLPDLRIIKLEVIPDTGSKLIAGQKAWVKATWQRTGGVPTAVFRLGLRVDGRFPTASPCAICGSTLNDDNLARDNGSLMAPWTAVAGAHTAEAFIDCENVVRESSERNNRVKITFKVLPAPLVVAEPEAIRPKGK